MVCTKSAVPSLLKDGSGREDPKLEWLPTGFRHLGCCVATPLEARTVIQADLRLGG